MTDAYILAGGRSRRFGTDKARARVDGATLVERNAAILAERYGSVTVVSAPGRTYADLGLRTIADAVSDRGPLGGIQAALRDASGDVAVAACDLLGLRAEWYELLEQTDGPAVAFRDTRWQPVVAIYRQEALADLERRLSTGELAVYALLEALGTAVAPPDGFEALRSIDSPEDL